MTKETEVKVALTFDRMYHVLKSTWHVALLLFWLIWMIAAYKTSLDQHLQNIDQHMRNQDRQLNWLINHSPYQHDGEGYDPSIQPEKTSPKPQSWNIIPEWARSGTKYQDSGLPPSFVQK